MISEIEYLVNIFFGGGMRMFIKLIRINGEGLFTEEKKKRFGGV